MEPLPSLLRPRDPKNGCSPRAPGRARPGSYAGTFASAIAPMCFAWSEGRRSRESGHPPRGIEHRAVQFWSTGSSATVSADDMRARKRAASALAICPRRSEDAGVMGGGPVGAVPPHRPDRMGPGRARNRLPKRLGTPERHRSGTGVVPAGDSPHGRTAPTIRRMVRVRWVSTAVT